VKIGVFDPIYANLDLEAMLDAVAAAGLDAVELGTGGYPGDAHCKPDELLADSDALARFRDAIESRGLIISALSCHGNPLHPDRAFAERSHATYVKTLKLAERLGVGVVNLFSGCPGEGPEAHQPNWVTCAWPTEYQDILRWQWDESVIPYWRQAAPMAADHGVKLGFEMHPGFVVYNPSTFRRLRDAVGPMICANLDPSHLFWQQIDPILTIRELGEAIVHVHAKDTAIDRWNTARNGVLDSAEYGDIAARSWVFRSVGYGHDVLFWKSFVSALRVAGYDHVVSIEHEDRLASINEGMSKAIAVLREAVLREPGVNIAVA
jgi:sugar phosphate isomerase/epimerase